jgi:hypothetical protein
MGGSWIETMLAKLVELAEAKITHPGREQEDARGQEKTAQAERDAHCDRPEVIGERSGSENSYRIDELAYL